MKRRMILAIAVAVLTAFFSQPMHADQATVPKPGPYTVTVPNVIGMTYEQAAKAFNAAGCTMSSIAFEETSSQSQVGKVSKQSIAAGQKFSNKSPMVALTILASKDPAVNKLSFKIKMAAGESSFTGTGNINHLVVKDQATITVTNAKLPLLDIGSTDYMVAAGIHSFGGFLVGSSQPANEFTVVTNTPGSATVTFRDAMGKAGRIDVVVVAPPPPVPAACKNSSGKALQDCIKMQNMQTIQDKIKDTNDAIRKNREKTAIEVNKPIRDLLTN
jgi:hypothetical protein